MAERVMRVRPQQERARAKVELIVTATVRLMDRVGVDAVSILAIAQEADLPAATIYHYFADRTAIFVELAHRAVEDIDRNLAEQLEAVSLDFQPAWGSLIYGLYTAYRNCSTYRKLLPYMRTSLGMDAVMLESNQKSAQLLAEKLALAGMPQKRSLRFGLMIAELTQFLLDRALLQHDEEESEDFVQEFIEMIEGMVQFYQQRYVHELA